MKSFDTKRPGETVLLIFDFSVDTPTLSSAAVATVPAADGAEILSGGAVIVGKQVQQWVTRGVDGKQYTLVAKVVRSDAQTRELAAVMAVSSQF